MGVVLSTVNLQISEEAAAHNRLGEHSSYRMAYYIFRLMLLHPFIRLAFQSSRISGNNDGIPSDQPYFP